MPTIVEQARLGWGNPDDANYRTKHIVTFTACGVTMTCRREVKPLFHALMLILDREYDLDRRKDDWGYANRDIRGYPGSKSYHAWGLAIDLDATENVLGSSTFRFRRVSTARIAENLSLVWGGSWPSRPDAMHFEFRGSTRDVARAIAKMKRKYPLVARKVLSAK